MVSAAALKEIRKLMRKEGSDVRDNPNSQQIHRMSSVRETFRAWALHGENISLDEDEHGSNGAIS
jgi:hypothetical protein